MSTNALLVTDVDSTKLAEDVGDANAGVPQSCDSRVGGGVGIRTPGSLRYDDFQNRSFRPLRHPSAVVATMTRGRARGRNE